MQRLHTNGPLARMLQAMLEKAEADNRHWDNLALFRFAGMIAEHYGVPASEVLDLLETSPPSILDNARNPQGFTAIGIYIASTLGADGPALVPTLH